MRKKCALAKKITKRGKKADLGAESEARNVNTDGRPPPRALLPS